MDTGKVVLGVVAGVAIGALLGVLFAPAKGSETRKKIIRAGEDNADAIKEKLSDLLESLTEKFEKAKEDVAEFAERSKAAENQ